MPLSLMVRPSRSDTCCDPRSEWRVQPAGGLLRAIAILSASSASPASMRSDIDQPTALPGHMPITSARQGHPRRVRTQAMSANRALSGPSAVKSRPTRSGAAPACGAAALGGPSGLPAQPRVVLGQPLSRMMRATRLRDVRKPRRRSSMCTLGAP